VNESVRNRSAAVRDYLSKIEPPIDPMLIHRYSLVSARWEATRLLIDRGNATPADDKRFTELSDILRALTRQISLSTCTENDRGADGIPGLTWPDGWLPCDPSRIVEATWKQAAEGW
jgi:hypothetical protein